MGGEDRTADAIIAGFASRQHGLVTREQAIRGGITKKQIEIRLGRSSLFHLHRGVYLVGHTSLTLEARYLAAVLACGEGALLAGEAGGFLLNLLRTGPAMAEVITRTERRVAGVVTRRRRSLTPLPSITFKRIPVLSPAALLVDLAQTLAADELARACHEAGIRYRTTPAHVDAVLRDQASAPGAALLRSVMSGEVKVTLSKLEARFLALLTAAGLPLPITNRPAGTKRVDCRWPQHRVTVELDSYTFHNSRYAWEQDRRRERQAIARGDQFRRYTYYDVFHTPDVVVRELRPLLATGPS